MGEVDALSGFDFDQVTGTGLFLKFQGGRPITMRVLTTDPVVSSSTFEKNDEVTFSTRFAFIIYNHTDQKAQIMQVPPTLARKISEIHKDPDFGANIKQVDLKISPTGEQLQRRYEVQVLPSPRALTPDQVKEAQSIDLEARIENGYRMSMWKPENKVGSGGSSMGNSGYEKARATAESLKQKSSAQEDDLPPTSPDNVVEDIGDEPINLDDIPF